MPFEIKGNLKEEVGELIYDSRLTTPRSAFFAIKGLTVDGHQFISQAIERGAKVIFTEDWPLEIDSSVTYVRVEHTAQAMAQVANKFFDKPSSKLKLVGVTGTNGKTTIVTLLYQLFSQLGYKVGLISTIENRVGDRLLPTHYTTPDSVSVNRLLMQMVQAGCTFAFMEVSSHAVAQNRIEALSFTGGVFTNLSHDHLDYHKTFDEYLKQKKRFFDELSKSAFALSNTDDKRGAVMLQNTRARKSTYGMLKMADYKGKLNSNDLYGLSFQVNGVELYSQLMGLFNVYNLLAVYAVAQKLGVAQDELVLKISQLKPAPGRMDRIDLPDKKAVAFIDYAHTPDALEKILVTVYDLKPKTSKVICVVGCGGNRDKSKRPIMARIAQQKSDWAILTSDNPRDEDPEQILRDMEAGIDGGSTDVLSIVDRKQAIKTAIALCKEEDIIVIAGKGHEDYQEIKGKRFPFDDKKIVMDFIHQDI